MSVSKIERERERECVCERERVRKGEVLRLTDSKN
jgi:hypothetical protein